MDLAAFANPWEHTRLLSDAARNARMITLLERHAPGARVLEVGCGTGLLACVAARLGARVVYAVEPTRIAAIARSVVAANGLSDVVRVLDGRVQDLAPRPVDLAFSELLNADPFAEGVLEAMAAAAGWVAPGGRLAPNRLRVWVALARVSGSAGEARAATRELERTARRFDLDLDPILDGLATAGPYRYVGSDLPLASAPVLAWDLAIGRDYRPTAPRRLVATALEAGPIGGAVVWFEATLDDGLVLGNAPGSGGHWGQLVCAWPEERGARAGDAVALGIGVDAEGVWVSLG
jgi:SAM-dependent methyltransferase